MTVLIEKTLEKINKSLKQSIKIIESDKDIIIQSHVLLKNKEYDLEFRLYMNSPNIRSLLSGYETMIHASCKIDGHYAYYNEYISKEDIEEIKIFMDLLINELKKDSDKKKGVAYETLTE